MALLLLLLLLFLLLLPLLLLLVVVLLGVLLLVLLLPQLLMPLTRCILAFCVVVGADRRGVLRRVFCVCLCLGGHGKGGRMSKRDRQGRVNWAPPQGKEDGTAQGKDFGAQLAGGARCS